MKPEMYLITKDFPYGHGEDSFVKPEYPYLCEKFKVIVISSEMDEIANSVANGGMDARIIPTTQKLSDKLFSFIHFLCERDCYEEIVEIVKSKKRIGKRIFRALMFGTAAETFYRRLKKAINLNHDTEALFYFYWFDYKCFGLTMHKDKHPNIHIVARTHGYDLYDERELYGKQFFKRQMDKKLDRLIFAAQYAKDYYLNRYQQHDGVKYPLFRLGVSRKQITCEQRRKMPNDKSVFLLISCSHAIYIKRIDRIIKGLSTITERKIKWVHIGGGAQLMQLQETAKKMLGDKANIQYEFTDALVNKKVLQFYKENYIGCFITTTETEGGSPVSVQEALSFGVPVIATAVGELPQMIKDNGILLSEDPGDAEIGQAIEKMAEIYGTEKYFAMCQASLTIYEDSFNADSNFTALAKELSELQ